VEKTDEGWSHYKNAEVSRCTPGKRDLIILKKFERQSRRENGEKVNIAELSKYCKKTKQEKVSPR
jgi:hypothetical protein